ncbi:MAG: hypothetical protein FD189_1098 [Elusimicrobia bacterium]|nr:MAG: hypothetical protein FD189_1098 [Elusimicrobiota bacterium]
MVRAVADESPLNWVERAVLAALDPTPSGGAERAAVKAYRDSLSPRNLPGAKPSPREEFEWQVLQQIGVNEANVLFGYRTRAEVNRPMVVDQDGKLAESLPYQRPVKRKVRRVVGDWLETTRAAVMGAKT